MSAIKIVFLHLAIYASEVRIYGFNEMEMHVRNHEEAARLAIAKQNEEAKKKALELKLRKLARCKGIQAIAA